MKNLYLINLNGMLAKCTYKTVPTTESYKCFTLIRNVRNACKALDVKIRDMAEECGVTYDKEGKIIQDNDAYRKFDAWYQQMLAEDAELAPVKRLHWDAFLAFVTENSWPAAVCDDMADEILLDEPSEAKNQ